MPRKWDPGVSRQNFWKIIAGKLFPKLVDKNSGSSDDVAKVKNEVVAGTFVASRSNSESDSFESASSSPNDASNPANSSPTSSKLDLNIFESSESDSFETGNLSGLILPNFSSLRLCCKARVWNTRIKWICYEMAKFNIKSVKLCANEKNSSNLTSQLIWMHIWSFETSIWQSLDYEPITKLFDIVKSASFFYFLFETLQSHF